MKRIILLSLTLLTTGFAGHTFALAERNQTVSELTQLIQHANYEAFKTTYEKTAPELSTEDNMMTLSLCAISLQKKLQEKNKQLEQATAASDKIYKNMGINLGLPTLFGTLFALMGVCSLASPLWDDTAWDEGTVYFGGALIPAAALLYFAKHNLHTWLHAPAKIKQEIEHLELISAYLKAKAALVHTTPRNHVTR